MNEDSAGAVRPSADSDTLRAAVLAPVAALAVVSTDEGGVTVLHLEDRTCSPLVLTGTAAVIWDELDGHRSTEEIVVELAEYYGADVQEIREQVIEFVRGLLGANIIEQIASASASTA